MLNTLTAAKGVAQVFLYFSMVGASESEEQDTRISIYSLRLLEVVVRLTRKLANDGNSPFSTG